MTATNADISRPISPGAAGNLPPAVDYARDGSEGDRAILGDR